MVRGICNTVVKCSFFSINLLICLFGAAVFAFSLWVNLDEDFSTSVEWITNAAINTTDASSGNVPDLSKLGFANATVNTTDASSGDVPDLSEYHASLWILTAMAALLFLVGFLGCCGAVCESSVLLSLFVSLVVIYSFFHGAASVFAVSQTNTFYETTHTVLTTIGETEELHENLKPLEELLDCCGATEATQMNFNCTHEPGQTRRDCEDTIRRIVGEHSYIGILVFIVMYHASGS